MKKYLSALIFAWLLLWSCLVFAGSHQVKPVIWACDLGTIAYNCARMGLPLLAQAYVRGSGDQWPDLSGNRKDGTVINALWKGGNLHFDGTGDYVDIPDTNLTNNYTLSFLAKLTDSGANLNILTGNNGGTDSYAYCTHNTKFRYTGIGGATADWDADTDFYNCLREYTIVVDSSGYPTLYLDGVSQGKYTVGALGTFAFNAIGKGYDNDSYDWQGSIHRVVRFSVALSSFQVAILANNPYGMFKPIPTAWYIPSGVSTYPQIIMIGQ